MLRVLIVEDDILAAMFLEDVITDISDANIVIRTSVADTKEALKDSFDVAFLDIDVTNGKTFEVARLLQEKQVPFIFVSGSSRDEVPGELLFARFIGKPYHRADIGDALKAALNARS